MAAVSGTVTGRYEGKEPHGPTQPKEKPPEPSAEDKAYSAKVESIRKRWSATANHKNMTFKRMLPWIKSPFEKLIKEMAEFDHNYDTICHAVANAAIAAAWAMNRTPRAHITGFQANYVMWLIIRSWGPYKEQPLKLTDYGDMLYPQSAERFEKILSPEAWAWIQEAAKEKLSSQFGETMSPSQVTAHPDVVAHWQSIIAGEVPFGFVVKEAA